MTTLSTKLTLHIPHAQSLKDKRMVARSLIDRTKRTFNVSVAEVDTQDAYHILTLGVAVVSGEYAHVRDTLDKIIRYMEESAELL